MADSTPASPTGKIDWATLLTNIAKVVTVLVSLFGGGTPAPTPGQARAAAKAAGCPDEHLDACCNCLQAALLATQAAQLSLTCCQGHCNA